MDDIREIVRAAGGQRKAARAIGANPSTVQSWINKGEAPAWRAAQIEALKQIARDNAVTDASDASEEAAA